uniref:Uncharacterized protein n=1 Tax=Arundo donax TaxID=35708 RepID=A0A0A9HVQ8_ARUDO
MEGGGGGREKGPPRRVWP